MALTTIKAEVRKKEGLAAVGQAGEHKVNIDEPVEMGGTDTGMNPMEMILCGLGGCQTIAASMFADKFRIDLQEYRVELEGDIDLDGIMGVEGVRPGFQTVRYNIHVKSDASQEKVEKFIEFVEKICPVGDTIANLVKLERSKIIVEN